MLSYCSARTNPASPHPLVVRDNPFIGPCFFLSLLPEAPWKKIILYYLCSESGEMLQCIGRSNMFDYIEKNVHKLDNCDAHNSKWTQHVTHFLKLCFFIAVDHVKEISCSSCLLPCITTIHLMICFFSWSIMWWSKWGIYLSYLSRYKLLARVNYRGKNISRIQDHTSCHQSRHWTAKSSPFIYSEKIFLGLCDKRVLRKVILLHRPPLQWQHSSSKSAFFIPEENRGI